MPDTPLVLRGRDARLAASLARPEGPCRAAVAALHPADDPSRHQFLFEHLATELPRRGVAVLRYDRRASPPGRDVPYERQAEDLAGGLEALAEVTGPVPTGLWGFSQGAWVALLTAARRADIAFLVLVGCSAVSPARQMRYGTAEQLRRAGYGPEDLTELAGLREAYEGFQRGRLARPQAQRVVDSYAGRSWFGLSWVPRTLPDAPDWDDMDFDPAACISRIRCPVLAFYGADEWIPVPESIAVWRAAYPDPARLALHELPGTAHHPTFGGRRELAAISPEYTARLTRWLDDVVTRGAAAS